MENNYEQKYKKALDNARLMYDAGNNDVKHIVGQLFPELAENEDERIRKAIVNAIHNYAYRLEEKIPTEWLVWLEKQGEKKSITFNNAHIIDSALNDYCCKQYDALHKENGGVLSFARLQHLAMDIYGWCNEYLQGEQEPEENKGNICGISPNSAWSEEDEQHIDSLLKRLEGMCKKGATYIATRFPVSQDIDWLKSLKERKGGKI